MPCAKAVQFLRGQAIRIIMDYWEKRIAAASMGDPKKILKKDQELFKKLRVENAKLREEVRKLGKNNEALVRLVEVMEEKIRDLTEDLHITDKYTYSYEHGGWVERGALQKGRVELAPSQLTVDTINLQLAEILRMIERHKMKEK
jgi:predicted nuclease with TOPRIM domain